MIQGIKSFKHLEPNSAIQNLHEYLESELIEFPQSKALAENLVLKKNENQHSSALCLFMTCRSKSQYYFERETSQKGGSRIDIGVYLGNTLIYTIEAKVLPTPKGTRKKPRFEHEYVYGDAAGIQRFKEEKHGLDHKNNLLPQSGLIAYIKEKDFSHWQSKVNEWINDASWSATEHLEILYFKSVARLISKHERKNKSYIVLNHFWLYV